jgi:CheY-like chemotaxis protein
VARKQDDPNERRTREAEDAAPLSSDRTWLEVKLLASAAADAPAATDTPRRRGSKCATVMVVAHDADLRAYIRDCLTTTMLRTLESANLASAEALLGEGIDLLIIDLSAPEAGPDVRSAQWPSIAALAGVPLLLITDEPPSPGLAQQRVAGTVGVVVKPFNARRLKEEVRCCLGRHALPPREPGGNP